MTGWIRPFVLVLAAFFVLPFVLTWLLFSSCPFESQRLRLKKVLLPGLLLNLLGNGAVLFGVFALVFRTRRPWVPLREILSLRCSWQDIGTLGLLLLVCAAAGLLGGLLLRFLFFRRDLFALSRRCRAAALLLLVLCGTAAFVARAAARESIRDLYIAEVVRKTTVFAVDPLKQEDLGDSGREICCVTVANPGPLDCAVKQLYLSESEDLPEALSFRNVVIPARGTRRLVMDAVHGLDLDKSGKSTVLLSANGRVLDQVRVPALADDVAWRLSAKGAEGTYYSYADPVSPVTAVPVFSRQSGFYDEPFDLEITAPAGMTVLYTLDCTNPAAHGTAYTEPVHIADPTPGENVWSLRTDVSASFLMDNPRFSVPDFPVDKCAVVRAVCVDAEGNAGPVAAASYFIGFAGREGYDSIGVVSIAADPEDLFDDKKGIYVLGETFRRDHPSDREDLGWWWWSANFHQKGRAWEREASVQFFGPDRALQLSKEIGIRIKGGASAGLLPKGLNLYAREDYDGNPSFDADFFGNGYIARRLSLSAGGNDVTLKVRDWLTTRLAGGLDVTMNRFVPYCVFLNGEYWGNYWLIEQYDSTYFAARYHLNPDNVVIYKNGSLNAGVEEDRNLHQKMINFFKETDLSVPENYEKTAKWLDIDDSVTYYAVQMYVANHDRGVHKNSALWRTRTKEDPPQGDTRWRWALFDVNSTHCYGEGTADTLAYMLEKDSVFKSLMNSPDFAGRFYAMLETLAWEVFTPEKADEALAEFTSLMSAPLALEHRRFCQRVTDLSGLDTVREFIRVRQDYILALCAAYRAGENVIPQEVSEP